MRGVEPSMTDADELSLPRKKSSEEKRALPGSDSSFTGK
jgi:hypothetical protein